MNIYLFLFSQNFISKSSICTYWWVLFATYRVSLMVQNVNNSIVSAQSKKLYKNKIIKINTLEITVVERERDLR